MSNRKAADGPDPGTTEPPSTDAAATEPPSTDAAATEPLPAEAPESCPADRAEEPTAVDEPTITSEPTGVGDLVVVCGLPGVGKTTVAKRVADHVDGRVLRTDVIRKELFSDPSYADEETEAVYAELLERAREHVGSGRSIVLDATFADARFRRDVRRMAEEVADRFELVKVECEESVVKRRIEQRDGISDADFDVHREFKDLFDGIDADHVVVDNSGGEAATFDQVDATFDSASDPVDRVDTTSE